MRVTADSHAMTPATEHLTSGYSELRESSRETSYLLSPPSSMSSLCSPIFPADVKALGTVKVHERKRSIESIGRKAQFVKNSINIVYLSTNPRRVAQRPLRVPKALLQKKPCFTTNYLAVPFGPNFPTLCPTSIELRTVMSCWSSSKSKTSALSSMRCFKNVRVN
jgi:hypothetical protein